MVVTTKNTKNINMILLITYLVIFMGVVLLFFTVEEVSAISYCSSTRVIKGIAFVEKQKQCFMIPGLVVRKWATKPGGHMPPWPLIR
jgi:hypothetical protein